MSIYPKLATLRPGFPILKLHEIVGLARDIPASGELSVNACFSAQIDPGGKLGSVRFNPGFPVRVAVLGYHRKMSIQQAAALRPLASLGWNTFKTLELFRVKAGDAEDVIQ